MTLSDLVRRLGEHGDQNELICVRKPWSGQAEAVVVKAQENGSVPIPVKAAGFDYFLEISLANELLHDFAKQVEADESKVSLLLFYAENDAFPDWVFQSG